MDVRLKKYPKTVVKILMTATMCLLAVLSMIGVLLSGTAVYNNFYVQDAYQIQANAFESITQDKTLAVYHEFIEVQHQSKNVNTCSRDYHGMMTNFRYCITNNDTGETFGSYTRDEEGAYQSSLVTYKSTRTDYGVSYTILGYLTPNRDTRFLTETYNLTEFAIITLYTIRYPLPAVTVLLIVLTFLLFGLLLRAAGHKNGAQEITLSKFDRIPLEVATGIMIGIPVLVHLIVYALVNSTTLGSKFFNADIVELPVFILLLSPFIYALFHTLAVRLKYGGFLRNTLLYRILWKLAARLVRSVKNAGKTDEDGNIVLQWYDKIPLEIVIVVLLVLPLLIYFWIHDAFRYTLLWTLLYDWVITSFAIILAASVLLIYLFAYTVSVRIQLGTLWTNTIAYRLRQKLSGTFPRLCNTLPITWRTAVVTLAVIGFVLIDFGYALFNIDYPIAVVFVVPLVLVLLAVFVLLLYSSWATHAITEIIRDMASGNINRKTDTSRFFFIFRQQAEGLNSLGDGLQAAVQAQMKSERFKTELITNVSHDIKTPLTSIINYADLLLAEIGRAQTHSEDKAAEYAEIIYRHSLRLKKLTEDLVEASKASSGAIHVEFERIELNQMLHQAVGEYEERMTRAMLTPICRFANEDIFISADGKLLWRVFDNLLSNIVKYSMEGTRVYITLTKNGAHAILSFKNISRDTLNVETDELLERFVRGDASRHSEGSGLGLNIAQSLCDRMNGKLELACDGDLFRADVTFPIIE